MLVLEPGTGPAGKNSTQAWSARQRDARFSGWCGQKRFPSSGNLKTGMWHGPTKLYDFPPDRQRRHELRPPQRLGCVCRGSKAAEDVALPIVWQSFDGVSREATHIAQG
jgi:hypothetical protein